MKPKSEERFWASLWREALQATTLGWELALPIFGGVLGGYFLDQLFGTGHIFTLGLLGLGVMVGYYSLYKYIRRLDRKEDSIQRQSEEAEEAGSEERTEEG